jgi:S-formylglutathione hydrolase FrmB
MLAMRLLLIPILIVTATVACAGSEREVEWVDTPAPSLEGNRLGSPTAQRTAVYLPPSYATSTDRRYPVLYLLHGIFDTPDGWMRFFEVHATLDRLIGQKSIREMIVVMPTGRNDLGGGFYMNSTVAGGWGDFIRGDLVGFVDANYRTIAERGARAVAGHSMGGFGAVWHAMTSADVFSVAYAMSPALLGAEDGLSHENPAAWIGMIEMRGQKGLQAALERRDFWPIASWAVCTSFLPDPDDEIYLCDPPYRLENGELFPDEEVLDRWRRRLPVTAADEHVAALRSMKAIALDYGIDDQFAHIPETTQELSEVLADLRVAHDLFVYRGDHRAELGQRLGTVVLPWISDKLSD